MKISKKAFTLAEVLITIGIIGVISTLTMPSLFAKIDRTKSETILKEDYSIILQALKLAESQDVTLDSVEDSLNGMRNWFDMFMKPNIKTLDVCYDTEGCWAKGYSFNLRGSVANSSRPGVGIGGGIISFRMPNGSNFCIDGWSKSDMKNLFGVDVPGQSSFVFYIDTNGDKLPNTMGKDTFILAWKDGTLVPAGADKSVAEVIMNCSINGGSNAGYYCLRRVMLNGWKIPTDI